MFDFVEIAIIVCLIIAIAAMGAVFITGGSAVAMLIAFIAAAIGLRLIDED